IFVNRGNRVTDFLSLIDSLILSTVSGKNGSNNSEISSKARITSEITCEAPTFHSQGFSSLMHLSQKDISSQIDTKASLNFKSFKCFLTSLAVLSEAFFILEVGFFSLKSGLKDRVRVLESKFPIPPAKSELYLCSNFS